MLLIRGGTVVKAEGSLRADVLVDGERIAAVGPRLTAPGARTLDATNRLVLPGAIDPHVHMALPAGEGLVSSDDFVSGSRAALAGGTTTLIDFATPAPGESLRSAVEARMAAAARSLCDWSLHPSVTSWRDDTAGDVAWCMERGLPSFKVYLAYQERGLGLRDRDLLRLMSAAAASGALVLAHCENGDAVSFLTQRLLAQGKRSARFHPLSRPPEVEAEAVERALILAEDRGCSLYVVHVSTAEAAETIRRARLSGRAAFAEACPHHLLLDDSCYEREDAADFVMSPPLRSPSHPPELWRALADGTLDAVSTDHCPFMRKDRRRSLDDFSRIPNGVAGVEHRLALLWTFGVLAGRIPESRFVQLVATGPARIFGLAPAKGAIEAGADADLVIWDPGREWEIRAATQKQRCDSTVYEGLRVKGRAETVLLRGRVVVEGGEIRGREESGRFVARRGPPRAAPAARPEGR